MTDLIEVLVEGISISMLEKLGIEPDFCIGFCLCDKLVTCNNGVYICGYYPRCSLV